MTGPPRYSGRRITHVLRPYWDRRIRDAWAAGQPICCHRCQVEGRGMVPLSPDDEFQVDHIEDRDARPDLTWDVTNTAPSHAACNMAAGARLTHRKRDRRTRRMRPWPT